MAAAGDGEAIADDVYGAVLFQRLDQAIYQRFAGAFGVILLELGPFFRLGGFQSGDQVVRIEGAPGIVIFRPADLPTLGFQPGNDIGFKVLFLMDSIAYMDSRRSIWPVTAAVMRAERRFLRRSMLSWTFSMMRAVSRLSVVV
jgi:hypothetical protein